MATVRNPIAGFVIALPITLGVSFLLGIPAFFLPQRELVYFYLPFALFGLGMFAGRKTFLGVLGFLGAMIGGFVGSYAFQIMFVPEGWPIWPSEFGIVLALALGLSCGAGGLVAGRLGLRRIEKMTDHGAKVRRCLRCGATVGLAARKCWSCRASLPRV